jgi:hypothetical protein
MSNFFKGIITKNNNGILVIKTEEDKSQKLFDLNNEFNLLYEEESLFNLKEGIEVIFSLEKKIYSDRTEMFAKVHKSLSEGWDEILKDFIKNSSSFSLSEYHSYLESNYTIPQLKKKIVGSVY